MNYYFLLLQVYAIIYDKNNEIQIDKMVQRFYFICVCRKLYANEKMIY